MADNFFDALPEYLELIMAYLPVLFTIAFPIAVYIAYRKIKNEISKAKETASLLGLSYVNVADEMTERKKNDSFLLGLISKVVPWAMEGKFNGIHVRVEQIVKSKQQRYIPNSGSTSVSNPARTFYSSGTSYTAYFKTPLPFDVVIRQNVSMSFGFGFMQKNAKDTIGTGDERLDQMLFVSGSDKNSVRKWLDSDKRKDALKKICQELPSVNVTSDGLHLHELQRKPDYVRLQKNLTLLSKVTPKLGS